MENPTIEIISKKLKNVPETQFQNIIDYIDYLTFKIKGNINLSENQLRILENSSNTPLEECRPAKDVALELRNKYK